MRELRDLRTVIFAFFGRRFGDFASVVAVPFSCAADFRVRGFLREIQGRTPDTGERNICFAFSQGNATLYGTPALAGKRQNGAARDALRKYGVTICADSKMRPFEDGRYEERV